MSRDFFQKPLGLVLSGGGALGAWQAAAVHDLEKRHGLKFDSVLGFSMGAITGANYLLGRMEELLAAWRTINGGALRFSPRLFPPSLFSNKPIWDAVDYALGEERAKAASRCRFVAVSALRKRSKPVYAVYTPQARQEWDAPLARHLVASCSIPVVFPPVSLSYRGQPVSLVDGGVFCEEPLSFTALGDCRDVLVLEMVLPEEIGRPSPWLKRLDQKGRQTCRALIDQGVASLKALKNPPRVFRLAPSKILDFQMLDFRRVHIEKSLALGSADAADFIERPRDYLT